MGDPAASVMSGLAFALKELQGFRDAAKSPITQQVLSDCIAQVDAMLPQDTPPSEPSAAEGYQLMQDAEPTTEPTEQPPADTVESEQPAPVQGDQAVQSDQAVQGADGEAIEDLQQLMQRAQRPRVQQFLQRCIGQLSQPAAADPAKPAAAAGIQIGKQTVVRESRSQYVSIESFGWDQEGSKVFIYITSGVEGVIKSQVKCEFSSNSFDLQVCGLNGKNYRLLKQPLEHDVITEKCKFVVKKNRITITLHKTEGKYGPDHWTGITAKKGAQKKEDKPSESDDPSASIMNMMKELYDDGDETTRKLIGEAMLKNQTGEDQASN